MFEFQPINEKEREDYALWVENHPAGRLFHTLAWIDFICKEHRGVAKIYRVRRDGAVYGYWPFVLVKKGPFRLLGSPLRGWLTSKMGPLLEGPAEPELIAILVGLCAKEGISYFETAGDCLEDEVMVPQGFTSLTRETWVLDLCSTPEEQWAKLKHNCKKNIKKAERSGIEIRQLDEDTYHLPLYQMVADTLKSKKLAVPFQYRRLQLLKETVGQAGRLLFLGAFYQENFIGGHIWAYDRKTAYALVSASREEFREYRVNNLLLWEGIKRFIGMGLKQYDMYGGGKRNKGVADFKASFGSQYLTRPHFAISFSKIFSGLLYFYNHHYLSWKKHPLHL